MSNNSAEEIVMDYAPTGRKNRHGLLWAAFVITWMVLLYVVYLIGGYSDTISLNKKEIEKVSLSVSSVKEIHEDVLSKISANKKAFKDIDGLSQKLSTLEQSVAALPQTIKLPADVNKADKKDLENLVEKLTEISNKIQKLEEDITSKVSSDGKMYDSIAQTLIRLRDRVNNSEDYSIEIDILKQFALKDENLKQKITDLNYSLSKTLSLPVLRKEYDTVVEKIKAMVNKTETPEQQESDDSFWKNITESLSSQVHVKKITEGVLDEETQKSLNLIKDALVEGDLDKIIKLSGALKTPASDMISSWREKVKTALNTQQLLNKIYNYAKEHSPEFSVLPEKTEENAPQNITAEAITTLKESFEESTAKQAEDMAEDTSPSEE